MSKYSTQDLLMPYQKKWIADSARFKIWLKSRQIGGSFSAALDLVYRCAKARNTRWMVISSGERLAEEFIRESTKWVKSCVDGQLIEPGFVKEKISELDFKNGSRIMAVPSKAATIRGFSTNLLLDEFAFHEKPDLLWTSLAPSIINKLTGDKSCHIISTPNGITNTFHDVWANMPHFSKHLTTIWDAIAQGFPCDIDALRDTMSVNAFRQEFECEFLDNAAGQHVFTVALIQKAMYEERKHIPGRAYAFIDFAAGRDENVIAILWGNRVLDLECWIDKDTVGTVGRCVQRLKYWQSEIGLRPEDTFCDKGGMGDPMMKDMWALGWPIRGVNFGGVEGVQENIYNQGTQMYFDTARILEREIIILPKDRELFAQLSTRKYHVNERGKSILVSKSKLNKSPDRGDAVCGVISCAQMKPTHGRLTNDYLFDTSAPLAQY